MSGSKAKAARNGDKPSGLPDTFVPVKIDTAQAKARVAEAEQVPIFEVDGQVFTMPKVARAELGIEYLSRADRGDENGAAWYLLNETLGKDAVNALRKIEGLSDKEFDGIMLRVQKIAMPEGRKRPKGARR